MIPKIIHYCWFGKQEKNQKIVKQIAVWKTKMPEFKFIEWNELNFPLDQINSKYFQEAVELKKWAFVTDYVRLYVLYMYGGVYLDTDIKVLKSFRFLLNNKSFIGLEDEHNVCTAVIGSEPKQVWIKQLLDLYNERIFIKDGKIDRTPNSKFIFEVLENDYTNIGVDPQNKRTMFDGLTIYGSSYFSPINFATRRTNFTKNTVTIHLYDATWKTKLEKAKDFMVIAATRIIGESMMEVIKGKIRKC